MMENYLSLSLQIGVFIVVVAATLIAARSLNSFVAIRRRLGDGPSGREASAKLIRDRDIRHPLLVWVQSTFLASDDDRSKLRSDLTQAGFEHPAAPTAYVAIRFGLAIALPLAFIVAAAALHRQPSGALGALFPVALSGIGLLGPRTFINTRSRSRRSEVEHQFPDALDLMVVCVEAGLGLEAALVRVGEETVQSHPEIAREFNQLADELSAGRSRADALRAMADRLNVETIKAFVALLIQTEALGVSIAQSLRTYSAEMRETRFLKAEEKAMRVPVLMTLPLVACFMPVVIVALLLPTTIDIIRTVIPAMSQSSLRAR